MDSCLLTQDLKSINPKDSIYALENGKILFYPGHYFSPIDPSLMSESILDKRHKNVSYDYKKNKLGVFKKSSDNLDILLTELMRGFAEFAFHLVQTSLPDYDSALRWGRTSFRPAQISGRVTSKRKDDTRLHVDSFASNPVNGLRILRVFCNVNPNNEPRIWNIGEPFSAVLSRFSSRINTYNPLTAKFLQIIKTTKALRSPYDHYMLHLHDTMKLDDGYQEEVSKTQINFPAQSSWIVFTDHVSHAALSGQYLLEQTFYLPVDKMANPVLSPLHEWRKYHPELNLGTEA